MRKVLVGLVLVLGGCGRTIVGLECERVLLAQMPVSGPGVDSIPLAPGDTLAGTSVYGCVYRE